jgi:hypothetical protein
MMDEQVIAAALRANGVQVLEVYGLTDSTDAGLKLAGDISVQCSIYTGGVVVNLWVEAEQAMYHGAARNKLSQVLADIRAAQNRSGRYAA